MSFSKTDKFVDNLGEKMHLFMLDIIKRGIYDKPESPRYIRTFDMADAIKYKTYKDGDGVNKDYKIKVYYDINRIRPIMAADPDYFNHHMTGMGFDPSAEDVSHLLPMWYDKGFKRHNKSIMLRFVDKTKRQFPPELVKDVVAKDLKDTLLQDFAKYKK